MRKPRQFYLIWILLSLAALCFLLRGAWFGISFLANLAGLICLLGAAFTLLTWPWPSPRRRQTARILRRLCYVLMLAFLISFSWVEVSIWQTARRAESITPTAHHVLVLGAGLQGEQPSATLVTRLQVVLAYLQQNPAAQAVLSGGQGPGESLSEAEAMQNWLVSRGIDQGRLGLENQATSTVENFAFSLPLLLEQGAAREIVLVTSDFHLLRAEKLAHFYGLQPQLLGCPQPSFQLVRLNNYVREYFAVVKDLLWLSFFPGHMPKAEIS